MTSLSAIEGIAITMGQPMVMAIKNRPEAAILQSRMNLIKDE